MNTISEVSRFNVKFEKIEFFPQFIDFEFIEPRLFDTDNFYNIFVQSLFVFFKREKIRRMFQKFNHESDFL